MELLRLDRQKQWFPSRDLHTAAKKLRRQWQARGWSWPETLTVTVLSKNDMRRLNFQYRGKSKNTDVLTFRLGNHAELFFEREIIGRQAKIWGGSLTSEVVFLFLHGMLHWQGFDHESPQEAKVMYELQNTLFQRIWPSISGRRLPQSYALIRNDP